MVNYAMTLRDQEKLQKYLVMAIANIANKDENLKNNFKAIGEYHLLMQNLTIDSNKNETINKSYNDTHHNYTSNTRLTNSPTNILARNQDLSVLNNDSDGLPSDGGDHRNQRTNLSMDSGHPDKKTPRSGVSSGTRQRKPSIGRERSDSRDDGSSGGFDPLKLDPNYRSKIRGNKFQLPSLPPQNGMKSFK